MPTKLVAIQFRINIESKYSLSHCICANMVLASHLVDSRLRQWDSAKHSDISYFLILTGIESFFNVYLGKLKLGDDNRQKIPHFWRILSPYYNKICTSTRPKYSIDHHIFMQLALFCIFFLFFLLIFPFIPAVNPISTYLLFPFCNCVEGNSTVCAHRSHSNNRKLYG